MKDHLKVRSAEEVILVYVLMIRSQMIALTIMIEFLVTCNKYIPLQNSLWDIIAGIYMQKVNNYAKHSSILTSKVVPGFCI